MINEMVAGGQGTTEASFTLGGRCRALIQPPTKLITKFLHGIAIALQDAPDTPWRYIRVIGIKMVVDKPYQRLSLASKKSRVTQKRNGREFVIGERINASHDVNKCPRNKLFPDSRPPAQFLRPCFSIQPFSCKSHIVRGIIDKVNNKNAQFPCPFNLSHSLHFILGLHLSLNAIYSCLMVFFLRGHSQPRLSARQGATGHDGYPRSDYLSPRSAGGAEYHMQHAGDAVTPLIVHLKTPFSYSPTRIKKALEELQ